MSPLNTFEDSSEISTDHGFTQYESGASRAGFLGSVYGISMLIHLGAILLLTFVVFFTPKPVKRARLIARREVREQPFDETIERKIHRKPKVLQQKEEVEKPVIQLEEEVEITRDKPLGESMDNQSNKALDSTSAIDAIGIGGGGAGRFGDPTGRLSRIPNCGGPGESAVLAALRWLKRAQSSDGRWDCDNWTHMRAHPEVGFNAGAERYDVGVSSLALLAYLGHGETHRFGRFKRTVAKGLRWLRRQQNPRSGAIGFHEGEDIYNHAIATMALCEAYAMSRDFKLKKPAQKAVDYCLKAQNANNGWKYGIKPGNNDTSVTGWMVLALKAAKTAGLEVPLEAFEGARNWFQRMTNSEGKVGYSKRGGGSSYIPSTKGKYDEAPCMTAVSVICQIFTGEKASNRNLKRGANLLMKSMPDWSTREEVRTVNFYYWYYGTYAMFQVGGSKWEKWNKAMLEALLKTQNQGGKPDGSWDPVGEWCVAGGRVYATAINCLTLEIYYRYSRAKN